MPLKTVITLHCSWRSDGFVELLWRFVAENRANNYDINKKIVNLGFNGLTHLSLSCHRSWPQSWLPSALSASFIGHCRRYCLLLAPRLLLTFRLPGFGQHNFDRECQQQSVLRCD